MDWTELASITILAGVVVFAIIRGRGDSKALQAFIVAVVEIMKNTKEGEK